MKTIGSHIKYIPATEAPLSADVYFVEGCQNCYIFDVGNNEDALRAIQSEEKETVIILSHHHADHTGNIRSLGDRRLYAGDLTVQTIGKGTVVKTPTTITDGITLEIIPCPSPHTAGSLILNVNKEYTLIADLFFTKPPFEIELAQKMIETLEAVDTKYFIVSHSGSENIYERWSFIRELKNHFDL